MQIVRTAEELLGPDQRWIVQQVIGGANIDRQKESIRSKRPLVIVGTPGRLAALLGVSYGVHHIQMLAIDEADALIKETFAEDTKHIMQYLGRQVPGGTRVLLTSASLTEKSLLQMQERWKLPEMCKMFDSNRQEEQSGKMKVTMSPTLLHAYVIGEPRSKVDVLRRIIVALEVPKVLVFMNEARRLKDTLFRLTGLTRALNVAFCMQRCLKRLASQLSSALHRAN